MANNIQPEMIRTTKNQRERFAYALEQVVGKDHVRDGIGHYRKRQFMQF